MRIGHTLFRVALLGSTIAVAAFAASANAGELRADRERILAATGKYSSALPGRNGSGFGPASRSATYTVLYDFAGGSNDGQDSTAEVTLDSIGNIFGVTEGGGANTYGTIFEIKSSGAESLLHSFGGTGDGTTPDGAVTIESNGDMVGTTNFGGASNNGTIWKLAANGTYTVLHSFASSEGNFIRGPLIQDKKGNFYGTALRSSAARPATARSSNTAPRAS
jgi:uncharacterized repeat protein (TIGR03803 family)